MTILIDPRSGQPIYEQIVRQLRTQILEGSLAADTPLPSVRSLAKDLGISVITTRRAYDELEATLRKLSTLRRDCGLSREELLALWARAEEEMR